MFVKLAVRNVKRQLSNYLMYFVTVSLTVAMMFALCNLIFSQELQSYAKKLSELQGGLIGVAVAVSVVVAFVLGYASSFMLKLRKREFGTYLTLGLKRRDILIMFTAENLLIGLASLACGVLFGLGLYQGMIGLVARVMNMKISLGSYSVSGLLLTVGLTAATFALSIVSSVLYLRRTTIYDLLHAEKKVDAGPKHPVFWLLVTAISLGALIAGIVGISAAVKLMASPEASDSAAALRMFGNLALISGSVVFFHIGAANSAVFFLLKNRRFKCRGTNTFLLRQLSGQLHANAVLCGILALLITAAVLCTNVSFAQKASAELFLDQSYPFDVSIDATQLQAEAPYSHDDALTQISAEAAVKQSIPYKIYTSGNGYLHSYTPWTGDGYSGLFDSFITQTDFNRLASMLGLPTVALDGRFLVLSAATALPMFHFDDAQLKIGGKTYTLLEATDRYPTLATCYFLTVVPDEAAQSLSVQAEHTALALEDGEYAAQALHDRLTYTIPTEAGYLLERCPVALRAYYELEENSLTAILIVGELYAALIFVFLATAILTMKLLAELPDDRRRYTLLYQLGVSRTGRTGTMFRQTFVMFAFPFLLPVLLSIPAACICGQIVTLGGYGSLAPQLYQNAAVIAGILIFVQLLYFCATYITKKRVCDEINLQ